MWKEYKRYWPAVVLVWLMGCTWLWQPERQVRLHTQSLLRRYAARDWEAVSKQIAPEYADRWKQDKADIMQGSQAVFSHFIFLDIKRQWVNTWVQGENGTTEAFIKISGRGSPVAEMVMSRVNSLREPFSFRWQKRSWKPWDWQLISADQPSLNVERVEGAMGL